MIDETFTLTQEAQIDQLVSLRVLDFLRIPQTRSRGASKSDANEKLNSAFDSVAGQAYARQDLEPHSFSSKMPERSMRTIAITAAVCFASTSTADDLRVSIISSSENISAHQLDQAQHAAIKPFSVEVQNLHGGMQDGCQLVTISNQHIEVTVVPTRGMSILRVDDVKTGQRMFGWDSPVKEIVNPAYIDLESRGGLGWLEGFNEWMVRCGLEFAGHQGLDKFTTNTGDTAEMNLTLHGKIGNIPASEVEIIIHDDEPATLVLKGVVHERLFFGPKLQLTTELRMTANSPKIDLIDEVKNLGGTDQEFQLIYHANFGRPILEDGGKVQVAARKIRPMNETAVPGLESYTDYGPPTAGYVEQVFLIEPASDEQGRSTALLHNRSGDRGAAIIWKTESLPYLTIWKNTVDEADGYVTGIEPATGYPFNRRVERHYGRVPKLKPQESQKFEVSFVALTSKQMVSRVSAAVKGLQETVTTEVNAEPPATSFDE